jgi:hypothetical protein
MHATRVGAETPRATLTVAHTHGPDDDDDRDTDDDTAEIDIPVFLPEDDGAADLLSLAEHEARIAAAVRRAYPTADYNPHRGLIRVPADPDAARRVVPELAGCRLLQTVGGGVGCWFELTSQGA